MYDYTINKPKSYKTKKGRVVTLEPSHPITITFRGRVMAHIDRSVDHPLDFALKIIRRLNRPFSS